MRTTRAAGILALLFLLSASSPQNPGDPLIVTRKTTKLRAQKRSFAPAVAELKEGDQLEFVAKDGAWFAAKLANVSGFVHESDVTKNKDVRLSGHTVIGLLSGQVRPEMVEALKRVRQHYRIACITNNMPAGLCPSMTRSAETAAQVADIMTLFEHVDASSKLNMRKPDPRIYHHACSLLGVAPERCVYLDDLGINLKPARAMGMATIKVETAAQALGALEALLGMPLR